MTPDSPRRGRTPEHQQDLATLETGFGPCTVSRARPDEIDTVMQLRDQAAQWLVDQGVVQWNPRELPRSWFEHFVEQRAVWLLCHRDRVVGTVIITDKDTPTWGQQNDRAGYIHSLVIARELKGKALGRDLLGWAERRITDSGGEWARLDCVRTNAALRAYYERGGYRYVGDQDFPDIEWAHGVALYEKQL